MHYPIYVHQEEGTAYGAIFPDIPGCFTAADALDDLPRMAQEAVEVHFEGEDVELPAPSDIAKLKGDPQYADGFWMLVDIDASRVNSKPMRLNISLPSGLVQKIDRYADSHHMNRSAFLARAAVAAMEDEAAWERAS